MARARRDYAAEYARRVRLERERARERGTQPDMSRARGHGSHREELAENRVRRWFGQAKKQVRGELEEERGARELVHEYGPTRINEALQLRQAIQAAFESGRVKMAKRLYAQRDDDLPDWMYFYHGVFS